MDMVPGDQYRDSPYLKGPYSPTSRFTLIQCQLEMFLQPHCLRPLLELVQSLLVVPLYRLAVLESLLMPQGSEKPSEEK